MTKTDATKNPEFQKVVRHFLNTPPKHHKPIGKRLKRKGAKRAASAKPKTA